VRELNKYERLIIRCLLETEFTGHDELIRQFDDLKVAQEFSESDPSIELTTKKEKKNYAKVKHRIPVEAQGLDSDGITIHFLLHVVNGYISELEIYREDSKSIQCLPPPEMLKVFSLHG